MKQGINSMTSLLSLCNALPPGSSSPSHQFDSSSGGVHEQVALKHLMETVVPVLTALKHVLERAHSPLLRELMFYFGALFR